MFSRAFGRLGDVGPHDDASYGATPDPVGFGGDGSGDFQYVHDNDNSKNNAAIWAALAVALIGLSLINS